MIEKLNANLRSIFLWPAKLWGLILENLVLIKSKILEFLYHFKILRDANISLGKYHLTNSRFKDASIRFWIIDKLFAPNDDENLFWFGWTKIMMKDYYGAIQTIKEDNSFDNIKLHNYISNMSSTSTIPEGIILFYKFITNEYKFDRYFSGKLNLFEKFTTCIIPFIPKKSWNGNDGPFSVLEIGSYPFLMEEVKNFLPEKNLIDSVNFDEISNEEANEYNTGNILYRDIRLIKRYDFSEINNKYQLILAFDSISHTVNLLDIFKDLKKLLDQDSILAMVLPAGNITKIDPSMNHFIYSQKYISDNLKLAEFELSSITCVEINKTNKYYIIVAR